MREETIGDHMIRIEIFSNIEMLDDLTEMLHEKVPQQFYSILPVLQGYGKKGYALGDAVWPESNFYCLILLKDHEDIGVYREICDTIQAQSPQNGISFRATRVEEIT